MCLLARKGSGKVDDEISRLIWAIPIMNEPLGYRLSAMICTTLGLTRS